MAREERTRALLEDAGYTAVRAEEMPVRFAFRDLDEYESFATDTASPVAMVLRRLSESEREAIKVQLEEASFAGFAVDGGYELPGVSLNAVAS
jgi:hypothetical protein